MHLPPIAGNATAAHALLFFHAFSTCPARPVRARSSVRSQSFCTRRRSGSALIWPEHSKRTGPKRGERGKGFRITSCVAITCTLSRNEWQRLLFHIRCIGPTLPPLPPSYNISKLIFSQSLARERCQSTDDKSLYMILIVQ